MNFASRIQQWLRRTFTVYLSAKIALAILVLAVSAAAITVTPTTYQAELGGALNINNKLLGVDKGFSIASSGAIALGTGSCSTPVTFGTTPGTATTTVTSSDYVYDVQITNTTSTPTSTCYQVLLTVTRSSGVQSTYGPLFIQTTASVLAWQPIDANFDIQSTTTPTSPFSFLVSVTCQTGTCP
ncbi:MAG: hypothetical protein AUI50_04460 [Crenarchaeota archaeon 13_1_40CM_2_52_14]|nr:MAG: hypothetical protein AUI97_08285 [Crenarchaeota archaeon 13_1_40CM_3_52_17]OLD34896.1 MAG: hypothetical protein AUI50_04460 [Crenarchaeota archaeon 13_1_40CM_2_52_14]OLE68737.1 MAG: hypothetical protein AUF78_14685 [archaeon 13_1_20CM_2_51_12]